MESRANSKAKSNELKKEEFFVIVRIFSMTVGVEVTVQKL